LSFGQTGFGIGKAVGGAILLGPIGVLGGLVGRKKLEVRCNDCGYSNKPNQTEIQFALMMEE
jgi:tellurium resistance protein TerD